MSSEPKTNFDVVIVGCGPTGATLANLLSITGISVLVLEREPDMYKLPRAVHFDDETMRVFQTIGIANDLVKEVRVNPGMRFVDDNNNIVLDWPRSQTIGQQGWHASYRLHQPDLEKLLREAMGKRTDCTLLSGCNVVSIQQQSNHVAVSYNNKTSDKTNTVTAAYVVGCDGANSFVRNNMGVELNDLGFKERWLVVDTLLKQEMPELGDNTIQYCDPNQPMTYCRNPGRRRRWEMALPDAISDNEAKSETRVWALLSRWINKDNASIERKAVYTFRSAVAQRWRCERVMIAGDAAHLTPPFMGQGMCAGIRDASNLAWKIALCVKQGGDNDLLKTYTLERRPHVQHYINTAIKLGRLINSIDTGKAIQFDEKVGNGSQQMASISPRLGDANIVSSINRNSVHVNELSQQPFLDNGQKLDDFSGYAFVLLVRHAGLINSENKKQIIFVAGDDHPDIRRFLDELNSNAVLIRPDRYILAEADSEQETNSLIENFKAMHYRLGSSV